ncbi:hypothetical protein LJC00_03880 [Dysgonomonas sp. OttesenSCG-928-M03]|nr:hypothetical protein [Dysgonomonas sp. OttesenSCG-928-M03]
MKPFLKRALKFFFIPIVLVILSLIGYFIFDPFKVLYPYESYSNSQTNRDYITIETFKNKYPTEKYNSFIFGSSRLLGFNVNSWNQHLGSEDKAYKMEGFSENIYGIYTKIRYLDSLNIPMRNVLIVLDVDGTLASDLPQSGYLFRKHPETTHESWFDFHKEQFKAYFNANMILRYYMYKLGGINNQFVHDYYRATVIIDSVTNDLRRDDLEYTIKHNPHFFEGSTFYSRPDSVTIREKQITRSVCLKLECIADILKKQHADYKVIIGPIYSQEKYNPEDIKILKNIFGQDNIYDFSGKNVFTEDKHYYYENFHYRPMVGDSIMNYIYNHHN